MKERPIIFSGGMIKAILEGKKMQTRRVMKPQPEHIESGMYKWRRWLPWLPQDAHLLAEHCPFGVSGDRLWVRETTWRNGGYVATDRPNFTNEGKVPSVFMHRMDSRIMLEIIGVRVERVQDISQGDMIAEGIYSDNDGITWIGSPDLPMCEAPSEAFIRLWDSINAKRGFGWNVNPWVWIIEFKGVE